MRHQADRHEWYIVQQLVDRWKRCRLKHGKPASGEIVGSAKIKNPEGQASLRKVGSEDE